MKLLILGATGPSGRHLVDQALQAGDEVTALVRNPTAISDLAGQVTINEGDATSQTDVSAAMPGHDVVISALGAGRSLTSDVYPRAARVVVNAAREWDVWRLVWLSSHGVGDTLESASIAQKLMYRTMLRSIYAEKEAADSLVRTSGLDWTLVYPVRLTHGPATGVFRSDDRLPMRGLPTISRADVATFMLAATRDREWVGRPAVISY
jgi:putative NADH-flavin reductase